MRTGLRSLSAVVGLSPNIGDEIIELPIINAYR
jgi:hypothetical protein